MPLTGQLIGKMTNYVAGKLAEHHSFQRLSLLIHDKIEELRRAAICEIVSPESPQESFRRFLNKMINSGKDFLKRP